MMENTYGEQIVQMKKNVSRNLINIRERIAEAAARSGRRPEEITILAATKTVPAEIINHAISLGVDHIGENRVQELLDKYDAVDLSHCQLHMIGHLQTNKVRQICDKVSMIQSVDSVRLAEEIEKQAARFNKTIPILVEVNIGREEAKSGVLPEELESLLRQITCNRHLQVNGLMAIPPICQKKEQICGYFSQMRQLFIDISQKKIDNVLMKVLSMGMSDDYYEAILEGATMVRIGSALFGKRIYY